jgi:outer membrane protein
MKYLTTQFAATVLLGLTLLFHLPAVGQRVLTLDESLEIAMEQSPDMQQVKLRLERNQHLLQAGEAALKSNFSLNLTPYDYSKDRVFNSLFNLWNTQEITQTSGMFAINQPIKWTDGTLRLINQLSWQESYSEFRQTEKDQSFNNNLYLSFEQPIFTYNRTKLDFQRIQLDLESAALDYAIQKLSIEKQVNQNFYDVFYNKRSLEISIEETKNNEESYQIIKNKVDAGISAQEELYQAEINLANSRSDEKNAEVQLANALDAYKNLLGLSLYTDVTVHADISYEEVNVDLEKATRNGLKERSELRQQKINIQSQYDVLTETSAMNEFKGNISISYGIIGTDETFKDMYNDPTQNQKFSVSLEVPLWDWGEKKERILAQKAAIKRSELTRSQTENDIIIGIRQAYRNVVNQLTQIQIAEANVKNAQLTYDINLERYKNGDLTSKDLGEFQTQLSRQKLGYIQSLIQYKLALLDLKVQSLWDFEKNEPVIPDKGV